AGSTHGSRDTGKPMACRRGRMTAVLQARVTATEHQVLEQLARRRGLSMSDAVRAGVWSYLLAGSRPSQPPVEGDARDRTPAGVARVILLGIGPIEPVVANAGGDPCSTETRASGPPETGGAVSLGVAQAATVGQDQGTAGARVADVGVNLGPTLLPLKITVSA